MYLEQIDHVRTEPAETVFTRFPEFCRFAELPPGFRRYQHIFPSDAQRTTKLFFRLAVAIQLSGVEQVDAQINGSVNRPDGIGMLVGSPVFRIAYLPRTERQHRDFKFAGAELSILHPTLLPSKDSTNWFIASSCFSMDSTSLNWARHRSRL